MLPFDIEVCDVVPGIKHACKRKGRIFISLP